MKLVREIIYLFVLVTVAAFIGMADLLIGSISIWWAIAFHVACFVIVVWLIARAPCEPEGETWG